MQCHEFLEYAGRWMEGEGDPRATAHLDGCPRCRGLIADLNAIRQTAGELEAEIQPPPHVWTGIRIRLEAEGLIREQGRTWAERLAGLFTLAPRPALAGVYLAVVLAAAVLLSFESVNLYDQARGLGVAPPEFAAIQEHLEHARVRTVSTIRQRNPVVAASYRESLNTIDNSILECERMVREDPANELARQYLYGAYQQKAELVAAILERGALGE